MTTSSTRFTTSPFFRRDDSLVGVFAPREPTDHVEALVALAEGVCAGGNRVLLRALGKGDYEECDVAAIFGVWKRGEVIRKHRGPLLVVEKGFVDRDRYFHLGWNGLNRHARFHNSGSPPDRWEKLGVELRPWRRDGDEIVVCGQVPWDATTQDSDHAGWCRGTVERLRGITSRPVLFRPHPKTPGFDYGVADALFDVRPLAETLASAWAVVAYNSTTLVDAVIAGVPAFAGDDLSMAWDVANKDLGEIESPKYPDREQWAADLAYAQWDADELRSGEAWAHARKELA